MSTINASAAVSQSNTDDRLFVINGAIYYLDEMSAANSNDAEFVHWLETAQIGERFPAFVDCERVA